MINQERHPYEINVHEYTLDQFRTVITTRPIEGLVLRCTDDRRIDLGALCYTERNFDSRKIPKPLLTDSIAPHRKPYIQHWCLEYAAAYYLGGSPYTLYTNAVELVAFGDWSDGSGHNDFLKGASSYKRALDGYTHHLISEMNRENGISEYTANRLQSQVLKTASLFYPEAAINFRNDLPIISATVSSSNPTETPSEQAMAEHLVVCQYLFDGLSDFVLQEKPFPHRIPYMETEALLLPAEYAITTPAIIESTWKVGQSVIWDYRSGEVNSLEQCMVKANQSRHQLTPQREQALELLRHANADAYHHKRLWLAGLAQDAFISMFVANAGMNESQLRRLLWSESYETSPSEHAGFVVIKYRAGDMEQQFEIKKTFHKQFTKFLKLRGFLCRKKTSTYLFINYKKNNTANRPIKANTIHSFNSQVRSFLDPLHQGLNFQGLRKYKSVYLLSQNYTISTVSAVMQNSSDTILKHYAQAEEKQAIDEISTTLSYVITILERELKLPTPGGGCSGEPPSEVEETPENYQPDCRNFVGCVFCDEFRLHADEDSVRKLLSMRYVTRERLSSCEDIKQFNAVHGKAIEKIDSILAELLELRPDMKPLIERVQDEVELEYKLSPYWESLYGRLLRLKVIK